MARGNNGNALQHLVELSVARALLREPGALRLLCTHSMGPSERLVVPPDEAEGEKNAWFTRVLREAGQGGEATVLHRALRGVGATRDDYPNTARLVAWLAAAEGRPLTATLCEFDPHTFEALRARWGGDAAFTLVSGSWRSAELGLEGDGPWLWTMDPYTFTDDETCRGGDVCDADLRRLVPKLRALRGPGAWLLFCYSLEDAQAVAFRASVSRLADGSGLAVGFAGVARDATSVHLCGLVSPSADLIEEAREAVRGAAGPAWRER